MLNNRVLPTLVGLLICLIALAEGQTEQAKRPQLTYMYGPFKMAVAYKETSYKDKLKFSKLTVNYFGGYADGQADKPLFKAAFREDLVRCQNLFDKTPEMESLIDCKPLGMHLLDKNLTSASSNLDNNSENYVKRLTIALKNKNDLPIWPGHRQDHFHYPLKADHTELAIERILTKHNMTRQGLGFDAMSTDRGFFVRSNLVAGPIQITCTANLFIIINQTEPEPARMIGDDYPEIMHSRDHLLNQAIENGGFISVQDASCSSSDSIGALEMDATFIYRKQFPYIICGQNITSQPNTKFWSYRSSIKQTQDSSGIYNTTIVIDSQSSFATVLNFYLNQNFTFINSTSGGERMYLLHPLQSLFVSGVWSADSFYKVLEAHSLQAVISKVKGLVEGPLDYPNLRVVFEDQPDSSELSLSFKINRDLWNRFWSTQSSVPSHDNSQTKMSPELPDLIEKIVRQMWLRDEL